MSRPCFTTLRILCFLLLLFFSNGHGRKLVVISVDEEHAISAASEQGKSREMFELDYADAGPNVNGRSSYLFPSVPPPPPPPAESGS